MFPRLFTFPPFELFGKDLGPWTLHTYGVLLAIAFLAGLWVASWQARKAGMDPARVTDMAVYVLIAGLVGAKLLLVIVEWKSYWANPRELWSVWQSGGVFYGGLLGALPVAWWYSRRHALDGWKTADVLAPGVAIGQSLGRLGCLAAGCCHGRPADVPWAVTFRDAYAARTVGTPLDTPLHPTQIYESAATLVLFVILLFLAGRKKFNGQVALAYLGLYSVIRFAIEFYRGDAARGTVFGGWISTSQFISLLLVLGVVLVFPYVMKKNSTTPASAPPAPPAPAAS
jgi:phosphatidylglycerol---prolipoprotein diacylglyceryl transferase